MTRRVLLKLSGEALHSEKGRAVIDDAIVAGLAAQLCKATQAGVQVAIVVGGGNIFRGQMGESLGMDRVKGDFMGMLATAINALGLESGFAKSGLKALALSAYPFGTVLPVYDRARAVAALEAGQVVILAGGTGNPYFTTDTAAALRALELGCTALLKGTKVDGVYSADPKSHPDAEFFKSISFDEVLARHLNVMDQTAFSLCRDNRLPVVVFNMYAPDHIYKAAMGESVGSHVG